jgi:ATP phosphoribosyltransferase regulatory subunit
MLSALANLNGDSDVLAEAKTVLANAPDDVLSALNTLEDINAMLTARLPDIAINYDLAELRGYHYHTGVVFAAYRPGSAQSVAAGGRYDDIGAHFGHAQPATGFSMDVKKLATWVSQSDEQNDVIGVTWSNDKELLNKVAELREAGNTVVFNMPNTQLESTHTLVKKDGHWEVTATGTQTRG